MSSNPPLKLEDNLKLVKFVYSVWINSQLVMVFNEQVDAQSFVRAYYKGHSHIILPVEIFEWVEAK